MANIWSEAKKRQVIALGQLGGTLRRIEAARGVRRETAGASLKAAGLAVRPPGGGAPPPANPAKEVPTAVPRRGASPAPPPPWPPGPQRAPSASACAPYRELIELALARGRNAMAIWRDLVDDHGFLAQYASVRRFVVTLRGPRAPEAHPVIVTAPGEEGQVDYGDGPMVRHPATGKYRRTRLFLFTLGYSRKSVRLLTFASSTRRWCELHEETFRRLGGTVQLVVLDNLREGVLTPDVYDPALNPLYRDVLAHYGVVALPCRVGDPDRKGKVESAIAHTQAALKGLRFETLEEAQAYLDRWDARWADTRIHGTTKRQVAAMFAEERPALRPLPVEPFRYYQFGTRTVAPGAPIHRRDGELGVRRILGVLGLVKKHGAVAVEAACAAALDLEIADYRFVRRYLERHPAAPLTLRQVDPLIRELTHYRDVIARKTQEAIPT